MLIKVINFLIRIAKDITPASILNYLGSNLRYLITGFIEKMNKKLLRAKVILSKKELTPFSVQKERALVANFSITNTEEDLKIDLFIIKWSWKRKRHISKKNKVIKVRKKLDF